MTEASRVQKMLNEQNVWIDQLKSEVMRLNLELVGYKVRKTQLEEALHEIAKLNNRRDRFSSEIDAVIVKALDDAP
jgi:predicted  nucleic acid-binding Zn-ribbon protein